MRFWMLFATLLAGCASDLREIPKSCMSLPAAERTSSLAAKGTVTIRDRSIVNGDKVLAGPFVAIDSFDVSASRGEVVFSAKRKDNFDIGLVALEGSAIKWVPEDPADEVAVQWAPRGNKISYVVRAPGGDLVRTVHIPTAMDLAVTFPWSRITSLTWDAAAERYTVVYSTPDASERSEVARYGGEDRAIVNAPASRLDVAIEPVGVDAIVLRPNDLRYDEKLPVVIWIDDELYAWSDARASLMRNARVAIIVSKSANVKLAEPWMDATQTFVVGSAIRPLPSAISFVADPSLPAGRYRESGRVVAVAPAQVQSFASCFIADQLKRTSPTNGSSR